MERQKVIELYEQAGFKYPKEITENPEWFTYADRMHSRLSEFARLVELETLERAALECVLVEDAYWHGDCAAAATACVEAVRALKL